MNNLPQPQTTLLPETASSIHPAIKRLAAQKYLNPSWMIHCGADNHTATPTRLSIKADLITPSGDYKPAAAEQHRMLSNTAKNRFTRPKGQTGTPIFVDQSNYQRTHPTQSSIKTFTIFEGWTDLVTHHTSFNETTYKNYVDEAQAIGVYNTSTMQQAHTAAAIKEAWIDKLNPHTILLIADNDQPGTKAALQLAHNLRDEGCYQRIEVWTPPRLLTPKGMQQSEPIKDFNDLFIEHIKHLKRNTEGCEDWSHLQVVAADTTQAIEPYTPYDTLNLLKHLKTIKAASKQPSKPKKAASSSKASRPKTAHTSHHKQPHHQPGDTYYTPEGLIQQHLTRAEYNKLTNLTGTQIWMMFNPSSPISASGLATCIQPARHKHRDRTPSLSISDQGFFCHGCNIQGSPIALARYFKSQGAA